MVFAGTRASFAHFLIALFASFCAEGQPRTEFIAGAKWEFPGLAGPIAALQEPLGNPNSLALANNGDLLIADVGNNIVLRLSADGTLLRSELSTAIARQLGLSLTYRKMPIEILI